jgi:hypothetical protein
MAHVRTTAFIAFALVATACGDAKPAAAPTATAATSSATTAPSGGVVRGPTSLDFDPTGTGDPTSVFWDDAAGTLFIADAKNGQVWSWDDKAGFARVAALPPDPTAPPGTKISLGQLVRLDDGTFVVPRFGFGKNGAVLYVNPKTGKSGTVAGASTQHRRVALTRHGASGSSDVAMWGAWFETGGAGASGAVTKVTLDGETDYASGFQKPVSVLVHDGKLLVSDQAAGAIYALPFEGAAAPFSVFARLPSPDTLTEGPGGSVITGQYKPGNDGGAVQLRQVFPDGRIVVLAPKLSLAKPQSVAYDKTNRRVFVADSNGTVVRTIKIVPTE